jgi:hypothetical protein
MTPLEAKAAGSPDAVLSVRLMCPQRACMATVPPTDDRGNDLGTALVSSIVIN